ncbi:cytochrome c oxidase subunit 3 [Sinimarinibacterium thermocellulolyticum]|uniref:Cytochrome oxidase subunit III n=1 Tax=Sinimarinibacterium thermocellulolyticum TaxID=3170016 RepID=A0ABV2ACK9_9GAMM
MTITLAFLALLMAMFAAYLVRQSVGVQPWVADALGATRPPGPILSAPSLGLLVFLAVVTSIFGLTVSAYVMRMAAAPQWDFLPQPPLLWINNALLVFASLALQTAWSAARRAQPQRFARGMGFGGACTVAFVAGQALLWRELSGAGYTMTRYVGSAFFVLMAMLHALHMLGGLYALLRVVLRLQRGATLWQLREAVGLCALYWHFLLLVWAVLFTVLFVGAEPLYAWCRS